MTTEKQIRSWEELATYAASRDPEERAKAVSCIEKQREKFPDRISEEDVFMVKAAAFMNRAQRRRLIVVGRRGF